LLAELVAVALEILLAVAVAVAELVEFYLA
jgi:hypothetical protein